MAPSTVQHLELVKPKTGGSADRDIWMNRLNEGGYSCLTIYNNRELDPSSPYGSWGISLVFNAT